MATRCKSPRAATPASVAATRPEAGSITARTGGVADHMAPEHLAIMEAMRTVTDRLYGRRDFPGTDDPVEQARLLAAARWLAPAYEAALEHMGQVAAGMA